MAQYLIALGIVDCFRVYYGMGLIAKLLMGIWGAADVLLQYHLVYQT